MSVPPDQIYNHAELVAIYDQINSGREDFDFYRARLPAPPSRVLDIGCGTGRFAIELAGAVYQVSGVDPAPDMIKFARAQAGSQAVTWTIGGVHDLPQTVRFDTALMTGHAFQCLLEDAQIVDLFQDAFARLEPEAGFWFETRNPKACAWEQWTPDHAKPVMALANGDTVQVIHEVTRMEGEQVEFTETYQFGTGQSVLSQSRLRFMSFETLERLANRSGLRLSECFGNWQGAAFAPTSPEMIVKLTRG